MITLCETCFPDAGDHEVLSIGPAFKCDECGRNDDSNHGGLITNSFRADPRLRPSKLSEEMFYQPQATLAHFQEKNSCLHKQI